MHNLKEENSLCNLSVTTTGGVSGVVKEMGSVVELIKKIHDDAKPFVPSLFMNSYSTDDAKDEIRRAGYHIARVSIGLSGLNKINKNKNKEKRLSFTEKEVKRIKNFKLIKNDNVKYAQDHLDIAKEAAYRYGLNYHLDTYLTFVSEYDEKLCLEVLGDKYSNFIPNIRISKRLLNSKNISDFESCRLAYEGILELNNNCYNHSNSIEKLDVNLRKSMRHKIIVFVITSLIAIAGIVVAYITR